MGNPNHDPKTGEFSEGPGGSGSMAGKLAKASKAAMDEVRRLFPSAPPPEKASFTNPNVPLFGPGYQAKKEASGRAMAEVRRLFPKR